MDFHRAYSLILSETLHKLAVAADLRQVGFRVYIRNGSGQGHSTVNFPVRNEGGRSVRLLNLYGVSVVNI
jgi:hypothetical protein